MVPYGERPVKSGAPQLTSLHLYFSFLVSLTFTALSSESGVLICSGLVICSTRLPDTVSMA